MNVRLSKGQLHSAVIEAISSKSFVHRLLIAAALSDSDVTINTNIISKDMEATVGVLRALGASIDVYDDKFVVKKPIATNGKEVYLDCIESGSTARFIMPLTSLCAERVHISGSGKLPQRPFDELINVLSKHGVNADSNHLPMTVTGRLVPGEYEIAGNVSSQYISGLLFALPLLDNSSRLVITTELESSGYVDMTCSVLELFGIKIYRTGNVFEIPGNQKYHGPTNIKAEGDWSNGAYLLTLAKVANMLYPSVNIEVTGLDDNSLQKDKSIKDILCTLNGDDAIIDIDCSEIPDIVPAIAVLGAFLKKESILRNVERLRIKESDRIESTGALLRQMGVTYSVKRDGKHETFTVYGKEVKTEQKNDIIIDSFNDHRIVMAAAIMSLAAGEGVIIKDASAINKSYPGFFDVLAHDLGMTVTDCE